MVVVTSVSLLVLQFGFYHFSPPLVHTLNTNFKLWKRKKPNEISICLKLAFGDRPFEATWSHNVLNHVLLCFVRFVSFFFFLYLGEMVQFTVLRCGRKLHAVIDFCYIYLSILCVLDFFYYYYFRIILCRSFVDP